jgi:hypothetical protein
MRNLEEIQESLWFSADGKLLRIRNIKTGHLVNILNWLADRNYFDTELYKEWELVANYRKVIGFAASKPYPHKEESGQWVVMDPVTGTSSLIPPPASYAKKVVKFNKQKHQELMEQFHANRHPN